MIGFAGIKGEGRGRGRGRGREREGVREGEGEREREGVRGRGRRTERGRGGGPREGDGEREREGVREREREGVSERRRKGRRDRDRMSTSGIGIKRVRGKENGEIYYSNTNITSNSTYHEKYVFPLTVPLCRPTAVLNSTPSQVPSAKSVPPTYLSVAMVPCTYTFIP